MTKKYQVKTTFKVVLAGDAGTGKTSLVTRLTKPTFDSASENSNLINVNAHEFKIKDNNTVIICIWDFAGGQKYRSVIQSAYDDASGVFLVYDISNAATFEAIPGWLKLVRDAGHRQKIMLIGNKTDLDTSCDESTDMSNAAPLHNMVPGWLKPARSPKKNKTDLIKSRAVSTEEAQAFATENGLLFMETSALNGDYVVSAFQQMAKALSDDDHQKGPFQVVLIDRRCAANGQIHCVEIPLQGDLHFVALSYRWGELHETMVDTKLGYIAKITSFSLEDFYRLCQMMEHDPDLKEMDYVWVDAICVDQANRERRKATIYHMSDIYEHANHILAVPDLHLQHLMAASINTQKIIENNIDQVEYLYALFHGDFKRLSQLDNAFLDDIDFPDHFNMRNWLIEHTEYLTTGFTQYKLYDDKYDPISTLEHLCETILEVCESLKHDTIHPHFHPMGGMNFTTHYCTRTECPLDKVYQRTDSTPQHIVKLPKSKSVSEQDPLVYIWSKKIIDRSALIRQSVEHFMGLITDWSSRAWVISEVNIAKKKNNLKYWFIQFPANKTLHELNNTEKISVGFSDMDDNLRKTWPDSYFYKFDLKYHKINHRTVFDDIDKNTYYRHEPGLSRSTISEPVCQVFHNLMINQLKNQDFLEMMLKSKASRNEDRFYAVDSSSFYEYELWDREAISSWNIQSMVSVKLKLYEKMGCRDKLNLFFLSGRWHSVDSHPVSPTFATSAIFWEGDKVRYPPISNFSSNFNWHSRDYVQLIPPNDTSSSKYCLCVKSVCYYKLSAAAKSDYFAKDFPGYETACECLQIDDNSNDIDIVFIPPTSLSLEAYKDEWFYNCVSLIGNVAANEWKIHKFSLGLLHRPTIVTDLELCHFGENDVGFNIY